jgi:hypothetical protein
MRLPLLLAASIALPRVAYGLTCVPAPVVSLPPGDTNTPNVSEITHASFAGVSPSALQSPLHAWKPVAHDRTHPASAHATCPWPEGGAAHALVQEPHVDSWVGSKHVPLQRSVVGAVHPASPGAVPSWAPVSVPVSGLVALSEDPSEPVSGDTDTSLEVPSAGVPASPLSLPMSAAEHVGSWLQSTPAQP